jgi:hypothetical protein
MGTARRRISPFAPTFVIVAGFYASVPWTFGAGEAFVLVPLVAVQAVMLRFLL